MGAAAGLALGLSPTWGALGSTVDSIGVTVGTSPVPVAGSAALRPAVAARETMATMPARAA
jgi:hypothetical protein